jgi:aspartate carbamoyltransferase catalytic subunit
LPRIDEVATDVDGYEDAAFVRRAAHRILVRMALSALAAGRE